MKVYVTNLKNLDQLTNQLFVPTGPAIQKIINKSKAVRERAYCPYSKFSVGAALLCEDGEIIDGCNVENVSYGLTICAERSAIVRAVAMGQKSFKSIAICAEMKDEFVGPCGACRQVIR